MGSSLPRHGVGVRTKTQEKEQNKTKQNQKKKKHTPRANCKLAQKKKNRNNNLYDAWTDKCHDACSNAVITSSILSLESQNWLEHKVYNKNPKILKNNLFNLY